MSMKQVYLAIDAHARHCVLGSMNTRGEFLRTWTFLTGETELIRHIEAIDARQKILAIEEDPLAFWIAQESDLLGGQAILSIFKPKFPLVRPLSSTISAAPWS